MWFSNIHIRLKLTNISLGFSADEKAASVQADFIEEGVPRRLSHSGPGHSPKHRLLCPLLFWTTLNKVVDEWPGLYPNKPGMRNSVSA